jgi:predicted SprT family Zn-dependent metalloprotease
VPVEVYPRLKSTLGRVRLAPLNIQLSPSALGLPQRIEVITHEAAHAALALAGKANSTRPHGPEWRRLMAMAGFPRARAARSRACMPRPRAQSHTRYEHRCRVCQTSRTAKRPVPAWRCASGQAGVRIMQERQ